MANPADSNKDGKVSAAELKKWKASNQYDTYDWKKAAADVSYAAALVDSDTTGTIQQFFQKASDYIRQYGAAPDPTELSQWKKDFAWFQKNDADQQLALTQEAKDPTAYLAAIKANETTISAAARKLGLSEDQYDLTDLAKKAKLNNWTAQEIQDSLVPKLQAALATGKVTTGTAGTFQVQLSDWAKKQGLNLTPDQVAQFAARGAVGEQGLESAKSEIRKTYLTGLYPAWADSISKGIDPDTLFAPIADKASKLLERTVQIDDPVMQKLTQKVGADGKLQQVPLYDVQRIVRTDPELSQEWQKTDNAYATYADVGTNLLKMFGLR